MGLVISDSSTLIHLSAIGRLDLLKEFFKHVSIPPSVWREVVEQGERVERALWRWRNRTRLAGSVWQSRQTQRCCGF